MSERPHQLQYANPRRLYAPGVVSRATRLALYGFVLACLFVTGAALTCFLLIQLTGFLFGHAFRGRLLAPLACIGGVLLSAALARPLWRFWAEQDRQRHSAADDKGGNDDNHDV